MKLSLATVSFSLALALWAYSVGAADNDADGKEAP